VSGVNMAKKLQLILIVSLLLSASYVYSEELTIVSPELAPFRWETGFKLGGARFHDSVKTDQWMPALEISFDRRIAYPLLMGLSIHGGINDDLWQFILKPDIIVRLPVLPRTRLDLKTGPLVYFFDDNVNQDLKPGLHAGIALKVFIKRHLSLEVGVTEHIISQKEFNNRFYYLGINY
jgi:hypothetical protein